MLVFTQFLETIEKNHLIQKGERVLVAVSGGADSVALLLLLHSIRVDYDLSLYAFHLNHRYRGDAADKDQAFVEALCIEKGITCFAYAEDIEAYAKTSGQSFETAARERRYKLMDTLMDEHGIHKVALAHHLNDQVETFFQRLIRGSGIDGLTGMSLMRSGTYIRPLLELSKTAILAYLEEEKQPYCIDETNTDVSYMRNKIRQELIPYLELHFNPSIVSGIGGTMTRLQQDRDFLDQTASAFVDSCVLIQNQRWAVKIDQVQALHSAIRPRVIRLLFARVKGALVGFESNHVDEVCGILETKHSGSRKIFQGVVFLINGKDLLVYKETEPVGDYAYALTVGQRVVIKEAGIAMTMTSEPKPLDFLRSGDRCFYLSADAVVCPLIVRNRRSGDGIQLRGLKGRKAVKEIFRELKLPPEERAYQPIVTHGNQVVWAPGGHIADAFYVTEATQAVYCIRVEKL